MTESHGDAGSSARKPFYKRLWTWLAAGAFGLFVALGGLSDVAGGIAVLQNAWQWAKANESEKEPPSRPYLSLVNMDMKAGLLADRKAKPGTNLITFQLIVRNDDPIPLHLAVTKAEVTLGEDQCQKEARGWNSLQARRGILVKISACNLTTNLSPGDYKEGRMDFVVAYGRDPLNLLNEMGVGGVFSVEAGAKNPRLSWVPDTYSAQPVGDTPHIAPAYDGDTLISAAVRQRELEDGPVSSPAR